MSSVEIYIDGACRGNGSADSVGAYAYKMYWNDKVKQGVVVEHGTTNNRMELLSAISALKALKESAAQFQVNVYSDSQYVVKGITEWYKGWELKNYYQVKNPELWKELVEECKR